VRLNRIAGRVRIAATLINVALFAAIKIARSSNHRKFRHLETDIQGIAADRLANCDAPPRHYMLHNLRVSGISQTCCSECKCGAEFIRNS